MIFIFSGLSMKVTVVTDCHVIVNLLILYLDYHYTVQNPVTVSGSTISARYLIHVILRFVVR